MTKTRVMLVEDERIVALNLQQRLIKLGYEVSSVVTSGAQALEEIERHPPDVILMDVNIDGEIDGIETAGRIPEEYYIPVIYLTAYSEEATLQRARATKPYGFLLKPISERELHATIQMVVERRRADTVVRESAMRHQTLVQQRTLELREQVAEREKAEEALRQLQKMEAIGQLTGGIAHDFNNLLQGISGCLTLLQKSLKLDRGENTDRLIRSAVALVERATGLTHRLLAFARCQPLSPTVVDVNHLIETMNDLVRRTVGESTVISLRPAAAVFLTRCDVNQLESSILNLVINARDAMPDGGRLRIESKNASVDPTEATLMDVVAGQYVCIEVSDTGTGMTADVIARSFEPFFTTKPPGQGTGLGLSMIYGFARQSGGFTKIDSEVGRGTTVKLYLPQFEGSRPVDRSERITEEARAARDGEVVLIVEDDEVVRYLVREALHERGYIVLEAVDGVAALELLQSTQRVDLLITDMGLPGLSGRQVADRGRKCRPGLKVLFITGYAENAATAGGFLAPGMELLTKPFALDDLTARIGMMMEDQPISPGFRFEVT
jgi:signal transduction histidine kinase